MKQAVSLLVCVLMFCLVGPVQADAPLYGRARQETSGVITGNMARVAATAKAEANLLAVAAEAVARIESVRKAGFDPDDCLVLAAAVVRSEVVAEDAATREGVPGVEILIRTDLNAEALEDAVNRAQHDGEALDKWRRGIAAEKRLLEDFGRLDAANAALNRVEPGAEPDPAAAEKLRKDIESVTLKLAAVQWFKSAMSYWSHGGFASPDKARTALRECLALDPGFAPAHVALGLAAMGVKDYKSAIEDFSRGVELDPRYARAFNNRGMAWVRSGEVRKGIEDFNKAISLDPNLAGAYSNRGLAHARLKDDILAAEDLNKALSLDPKLSGGQFAARSDDQTNNTVPVAPATPSGSQKVVKAASGPDKADEVKPGSRKKGKKSKDSTTTKKKKNAKSSKKKQL